MKTVTERFLVRVEKTETCWLWKKYIYPTGYGSFTVRMRAGGGNKTWYAHRLAYTLFIGEIPEGMRVCHKCDVRKCVNPAHLFLGTSQANAADMLAKGRQAHGSRHGLTTLTEEQVNQIRSLAFSGRQSVIAKKFNVSQATVSNILLWKTWRYTVVKGATR